MAQMVAHLIGSEEVTGSIPVASLIKQASVVLSQMSFFWRVRSSVFVLSARTNQTGESRPGDYPAGYGG